MNLIMYKHSITSASRLQDLLYLYDVKVGCIREEYIRTVACHLERTQSGSLDVNHEHDRFKDVEVFFQEKKNDWIPTPSKLQDGVNIQ